eukprot:3672308-Prymnesium_polylepis.1
MSRSQLLSISWEGQKHLAGASFYLVSGLLQPMPAHTNWDAQLAGIAVKVFVEMRWCKVDMPESPFRKIGGGMLNKWYDKQMQFTNGRLVWKSHKGVEKKEPVTLEGSSWLVGNDEGIPFQKQ